MTDLARARLKQAADARKWAEANLERARSALAKAIIEAAGADIRQVEIVNISGYHREHIRRICAQDQKPAPARKGRGVSSV